MQGIILRAGEVRPDEEAAWRDLAARAAEANPLYEPDCVIPAARHQSFGEEIEVVVAEEDVSSSVAFPSAAYLNGADSATPGWSPRFGG